MTNSFIEANFVVFYSKHLDQEISYIDLANLKEEQLETLLAEAAKVASECSAGYEWSKSSSPNEWPDEDWPRRVRKKASLVISFVKAVKSEIKKRRSERHLKVIEKRTRSLELQAQAKAARFAEQQATRFTRIRYIKAAIRERFGDEVTSEILARAAEIADDNKSSIQIN
jgi:hypothetical protein